MRYCAKKKYEKTQNNKSKAVIFLSRETLSLMVINVCETKKFTNLHKTKRLKKKQNRRFPNAKTKSKIQ